MKSIGRTYLIKCEVKSGIELINGLYIPTNHDVAGISDIFYQATIILIIWFALFNLNNYICIKQHAYVKS